MAELTLEQQRAVAIAQAKRKRMAGPEAAPDGLKPGSSEYADWALSQVKAGKSVPRASEHSATDPTTPSLGEHIINNINAGTAAAAEAVPFVGPQLRSGLEHMRSAVQTNLLHNKMSQQEVAAATRKLVDENPVGATVGSIAGTVAPFAAAGTIPLAAKMLGFTGPLAGRMIAGGASGAGITFGDSLIRGDELGEAGSKALVAGGVGTAFPAAEKGVGWLKDLVLGKAAPQQFSTAARALRDDEVPVEQINQRLADLGPDAMVMDLGPNLQSQAGAVASVPGPGQKVMRDAVAQRGRGAPGRVQADVDATIGAGPEIGALREGIVQAQQTAAKPLYDAVRNVPLNNLPQLAAVARTPMGQKALREALALMENDGITLPKDQFTVGLADYMKRALDDIASSSARSGNNNVARQARNMTKAITSAIDPIVPGYKAARDAFAGPAQLLDAIELGSTAFAKDMSPAQLRRELSSMSPSERDGFLQGAQSQVEAMMGNAVNDAATLRNTFRKGWNEAKLRILLGDDVANDLLKRIDRELTFGQTSNAVASNSETARRQAAQMEVSPDIGTTPRSGVTIPGIFIGAFDKARNAIEGVARPQINRALSEIHTARQLSPETIRLLQNGSRASRPATIAPGAVGLLEERQRRPIEITIRGPGGGR
jgi:hypothetical protein